MLGFCQSIHEKGRPVMGHILPNIIQIEFFPPAGNVIQASREALETGDFSHRSKTVVRITDRNNKLTKHVSKVSSLEKRQDEAVKRLNTVWDRRQQRHYSRLARWLGWRLSRVSKQSIPLAVRALREAIDSDELVGIEPHPRKSFRALERNEVHEMFERLQVTWEIWFFVFPGGSLLSDELDKMICWHM
ncbi:MAG: hypothetical protein JWN64_645 [Parcubacteria group bacterium]|nr:hypothetical protein [Parcubacteria group bacterium]